MSTGKLTTGGQVTIPASVRQRWRTKRVRVEDHGDHVVVRPADDDPIASARGAFAHYPGPTSDEMRARMREEDQEIEDRKLGRFGD
ncbi:MAG: AbrB/MazE/SpoVT family DNA-binding domain-containing protein [Solirubrobacteraceae bacterium MAG38_C4-C5]|nr:AbrB/MazE/SpoVT family DNA-binding domain-containing protein [Candidatus Siliceabacter maunaloa]